MWFEGTAAVPGARRGLRMHFVVVVVGRAAGWSSFEGLSEHIQADGDHEQGTGPLQQQ